MTSEKRADIIEHTPPTASTVNKKPQWLQDRLEWFQDLKFGVNTPGASSWQMPVRPCDSCRHQLKQPTSNNKDKMI